MQKEFVVNTKNLVMGYNLVQSVYDDNGVMVASKDTYVDASLAQKLYQLNRNVKGVVEVPDDYEGSDYIGVSSEGLIDESISDRVSDGVRYIYADVNSNDLADLALDTASLICSSVHDSVGLIGSLTNLMKHDNYTLKHSVDVATMGNLVATKLGLDDKSVKDITVSGLLHDLGKTSIPDSILNKPARLTDAEFDIMQEHPLKGYKLIEKNRNLSELTKMGVLSHHEKFCGGGYMKGIKGTAIPISGRILSVVDVYDALVTNRPYRNELSPVEALSIMQNMSGHFDQEVFSAFVSCLVLFPVGSVVLLSNGALCEVIAQNDGNPLRPVLRDVNTKNCYDLLHDFTMRNINVCYGCDEEGAIS